MKLRDKELFWVTPESLSMEVLISTAERPKAFAKRKEWWRWSNISSRLLELLGYKREAKLEEPSLKAPLIFVHGSYHSAWCFAENFMPYFTYLGHDCYSVSLRGTAATGMPPADPGETVRLLQHVDDLNFVLDTVLAQYRDQPELQDYRIPLPVLVGHSAGALVVTKLMEEKAARNKLSGVALLAPVPPSGNTAMVQRFLRRDIFKALYISYGIVMKMVCRDVKVCRDIFFDSSLSDQDIKLYMRRFQADSRVALDLQDLMKHLPSLHSLDPRTGQAAYLSSSAQQDRDTIQAVSILASDNATDIVLRSSSLNDGGGSTNTRDNSANANGARWLFQRLLGTSKSKEDKVKADVFDSDVEWDKMVYGRGQIVTENQGVVPARLVLGGDKDYIVDKEGLEEAARYLGIDTGPVIVAGLYHDLMLGPKWRGAAYVIQQWLEQSIPS